MGERQITCCNLAESQCPFRSRPAPPLAPSLSTQSRSTVLCFALSCHPLHIAPQVRVSSNSDVYDARGFVAALLLFGALVALVVAGFFALGVRLHKSKTFWLGVLKKGWSITKRGWRRLKLFVEGLKTRASGKQDSAIILN